MSVTHCSYVLSDAFKYSHIVFASATYNNGIFTPMEELLRDIAHHALQDRTVALIQNGSWAPASGKLMAQILGEMKNMELLEQTVTLKSALAPGQDQELEALADALAASVRGSRKRRSRRWRTPPRPRALSARSAASSTSRTPCRRTSGAPSAAVRPLILSRSPERMSGSPGRHRRAGGPAAPLGIPPGKRRWRSELSRPG